MRIIDTSSILPTDLKPWEKDQVYNGLDACVALEVLEALRPQLDANTAATYEFSKALQGPVLEMRLRGIRIDPARKAQVIDEYYEKLDFLERNLERIVGEGCGLWNFNWHSGPDKQKLFYDILGIPVIRKGGKPTVDRNALEKMEVYTVARPIISHLKLMSDLGKKISVLKTEIDSDGRIRTSYNIAGTSTGRFSSSFSEFGTGGNLQNVEESLRSIFISDKGMRMAKFDAKSGESYCVGAIAWNLFRATKYLDVCESGDPHTAVAMMCWPELPWTNNPRQNRVIAEQKFYRHFSYRDACKGLGHGSNYLGKPRTLSQQKRIDLAIVEDFQPKYFMAFPEILMWHAYKQRELRETGQLISLTGRLRKFWGRRDSDETLREAMAYDPQCSLADIVNNAMLQVWDARDVTLYMHDHDALTVQYPEEQEDEIIPKIFEQLRFPIQLRHGRTLEIPYDCVTGWNRGKYDEKLNPDGLKDYHPGDKRRRTAEVLLLDRKLHRVHGKSRSS